MIDTAFKPGLKRQPTLLSNVSWETLEKLDADLEGTGARLTYLDGCLDIMAPLSDAPEKPKKQLVSL